MNHEPHQIIKPADDHDHTDLARNLSGVLTERWEQDDFIWALAATLARLLNLEDFVLYLREGPVLAQAAAAGVKVAKDRRVLDPITIPLGHGVVGQAAEHACTIHIADLSLEPGYIADHVDGRSELSVPILYEGEVIAVFDTEATRVNAFQPYQIDGLEFAAKMAAPRLALWKMRRDEWLRSEQARGRQARALETFAGTLAHDLNNILTVIELNALVLGPHSSAAERHASSLTDAVVRARRLTGRLLSLTSSGRMAPEIIDVVELLTNATHYVELRDNIKTSLQISDDLPLLLADPVQLPQVITNLVANAAEAIGDNQGTIRVSARRGAGDQPSIVIEVVDDGPGIDEATIGKIFDPYFSTKPNGMGLGLASAYWTSLQHGGDLRVDSRLGYGTTFSLRLPAQDGRLVESPPLQNGASRLRVLVLEDDEQVGEAVAAILGHCGHESVCVIRAEDVVPAWVKAIEADRPFDVALLDLRNQYGDGGTAALSELQRIDPGVRAIAMSGYSDDTLKDHYQLGFKAVLAKPFLLDELSRALSKAVRST